MAVISPVRERRRDPRSQLARPVKMRCKHTAKIYDGVTCDISVGGALLEIRHPSLLVNGLQVELGIAWSSRHMLLRSEDLVPATVMRSLGIEGKQRVAVRFSDPQNLAKTA